MQKFCTKNTSSESFAANDSKKVWNLKLPRVFRTPTKITSPRQPLTVRTRIKRNHPSRNTPTNQIEEQKPAHCSLLGMFDLTGLRGCLWWLFGSCIANCRGRGTKLGASEASEGLEDFVGLRMGWGDRKPKMRIFPL